MTWLDRLRTPPIFLQMLLMLLVMVTVVQVANAVMILVVGPPAPDLYPVEAVVAGLQGDAPTLRDYGLRREIRAIPPPLASHRGGAGVRDMDLALNLALARGLGLPAGAVRIVGGRPPLAPGRWGDRVRNHPVWEPLQSHPLVLAPFVAAARRPDGSWSVVRSAPEAFPTPWQRRALLWLGVCGALCLPLAYAYAEIMARPIRRFAQAADRLGRQPQSGGFEIGGSPEVRLAGAALDRMRLSLMRYVDDRTAMIAAIAHDLRTPLARMRFQLEAVGPDQARRLTREIAEMDAMIAATLAFVRDTAPVAAAVEVDLHALLESLVLDAADVGQKVTLRHGEAAIVRGDTLCLRRLFDNLIQNAVKYGGCAEVALRRQADEAWVEVSDRGPGVPEVDLERVFTPFYRVEGSRNRATGGAGLGLAVARNLARNLGGDADLKNRTGGGLTARVRLPLSIGMADAWSTAG